MAFPYRLLLKAVQHKERTHAQLHSAEQQPLVREEAIPVQKPLHRFGNITGML